jgi:hypothetical protein
MKPRKLAKIIVFYFQKYMNEASSQLEFVCAYKYASIFNYNETDSTATTAKFQSCEHIFKSRCIQVYLAL